jgi:hypothetical protein
MNCPGTNHPIGDELSGDKLSWDELSGDELSSNSDTLLWPSYYLANTAHVSFISVTGMTGHSQ